ncbi:Actin-related protein 4 [Balamuthia mandrillaris]
MVTMVGGDEVSALVIDIGSSTSKMGYAGEDSPKAVFPSTVGVLHSSSSSSSHGEPSATAMMEDGGGSGDASSSSKASSAATAANKPNYFIGSSALAYKRDFMEVESPLREGLIYDWNIAEELINYGLKKRLSVDPKQHPILLAEASFNTRSLREKATELMFERYQVPALFTSKNAVLATFASGRSSALVLDSGAGVTSAVAVHEGYALGKGIVKNTLAGDRLTRAFLDLYKRKEISIKPHYMLRKKEAKQGVMQVTELDFPNITRSYHDYMVMNVVQDIKESVARVSADPFIEEENANIATVPYELPDGNVINVSTERFSVPELLFSSASSSSIPNATIDEEAEEEEPLHPQHIPLHQMILRCIQNADVDARRELYSGIVVTGGNTLLPGFLDRLQKELAESATQRFKLVAANNAAERKFGVWIGGSILASLGTFQQMWMSKSEYEEHGASLVERKCP